MGKLRVILLAALALAISASALQAQQLNDPANLAGERVSPQDPADTLPINHGAPALQQLLLKLRTRASMMLIVAHPDDEDGGLLTYESRGQGARVAMLTLTRGEGGQNLMSADFDDALGLIRTQELLAADRYMGVDQFFGTEVDFGFSKTKEETFKKWTHDRVLYDAVRAVRLYRPLVIASVFVGGPTDGHGHHQVAGEIAQEVFTAAADPKVFPEMIAEGLLPWAALKVYARVPFSRVTADGMYDYATGKTIPPLFHNYVTGKDSTTEPTATVLIHEGERSTALGMDGLTYVQFARKGLALQKTQIGGNVRLAPAGALDIGYTLMASRVSCLGVPLGKHPQAPERVFSASESGCPSPPLQDTRDPDLFEDINTSLPGLAVFFPEVETKLRQQLLIIDKDVRDAQQFFNPAHIERTAPYLRDALRTLNGLIADIEKTSLDATKRFNLLHELRIKRVQLNNALVLALGIRLEPMTKPLHATYTDPLKTSDPAIYANARLSNSGPEPLTIVCLNPEGSTEPKEPVRGRSLPSAGYLFVESNRSYERPPAATRPYFSRPNIEQPFYNIADPSLRNAPATPYPLASTAVVDDQGVRLELKAVIPDAQNELLKAASPETLARVRAVYVPQGAVIIPPVAVKLGRTSGMPPFKSISDLRENADILKSANAAGIIPTGTPTFQVGASLAVQAFEPSDLGPARIGPDKIPVRLRAPTDWKISAPTYNPVMEPVLEHFTVTPGRLKAGESYTLTAAASFQHREYTESYRPVGYPGLTYTNYYTPATYRATAVDVKTAPNLHIAYLPGTGDDLPSFLPSLGITPTILTPKDLTAGSLKQFDAVILGVRAYAAQPALAGPGSKPLMDYVKDGGVVILQYNTARYGDAEAPFPITVPGDPSHNVVEEAQPVAILDPKSPVLTWPNTITAADFDHWVAERGHGFAATWSKDYTPLLETHDPEQDPQKGGLLYARTGKGAYIYCAFALYRQLPEGVPGAYRLLANLISLGKNPNLSH